MKKIVRWALIVFGGAFLILQFIRPAWNRHEEPQTQNIASTFPVTPEVEAILKRSCYDCHSNNTRYPWYAQVQPLGWWLQGHVNDGKSEVNFDEFSSYRPLRQYRKLQQIAEEVEDEMMPLPSYLYIHTEAKLSDEERGMLKEWVGAMRDSMRVWFPADSLQRPRRQPEE